MFTFCRLNQLSVSHRRLGWLSNGPSRHKKLHRLGCTWPRSACKRFQKAPQAATFTSLSNWTDRSRNSSLHVTRALTSCRSSATSRARGGCSVLNGDVVIPCCPRSRLTYCWLPLRIWKRRVSVGDAAARTLSCSVATSYVALAAKPPSTAAPGVRRMTTAMATAPAHYRACTRPRKQAL